MKRQIVSSLVFGLLICSLSPLCFANTINGESVQNINIESNINFDFREYEKINHSPVQVYRKTNFMEMRRKVETLFDSYVDSNGGYGPLYTNQFDKGGVIIDKATNTPTFAGFMGTVKSQEYMAKPNMNKELAEIAKLSFSDVKGTEWYAHLIPLNVYFGTVNGYTDGTFKGGNSVSRAEFVSMLCNSKNKAYPIKQSYANDYGNVWYVSALGELENNILTPEHLNKTTIMEGITRGECAVILAKTLLPTEYAKIYSGVDNGTITDYLFADITGTSTTLEEDYIQKQIGSTTQFYGAYLNKCKIKNKPPKDIFAALYVLKDMGIFSGDSDGNSNWTQTITRAETLSLITKAEQVINITK